jgi:hypothetical protein
MGYPQALRETLRTTASAYGYTLTVATTIQALMGTHGKPSTGELILFALGGLAAFAALESVLLLSGGGRDTDQAEGQPFPFAGALNLFSIGAALGAGMWIAHGVHSGIAWPLAPLAGTAAYMVVVAGQVRVVTALRG